jgi:hypothetical protein
VQDSKPAGLVNHTMGGQKKDSTLRKDTALKELKLNPGTPTVKKTVLIPKSNVIQKPDVKKDSSLN